MKRLRILILLLLFVPMLRAQHYLGVALDAAFSGNVDNIQSTHSLLGGAGGLQAVYHLQAQHFILQTGLGFRFTGVGQAVDTILHPEYQIYDLRCMAYSPELRVPLKLGVTFNQFYAMVGAEFAYVFNGSSRQRGVYAISGQESDKYFPDFNQAISRLSIDSKGQLWCTPDLDLSLELGINLPVSFYGKRSSITRLGVYAEYGLLNTMPQQCQSLVTQGSDAHFNNVHIDHIHTTYTSEQASLHDWSVGVRLTFLLNVANISNSYNPHCRCLD